MMLKFSLLTIIIALVSSCTSTPTDSPQARNQSASLELARQMVGQGEYQRAVQFLLPRSRQADASAEVHTLLGLSFLGLNNPNVAIKSFQAALKANDGDDDARLNLGYTLILVGKLKESRVVLEEIVKRNNYSLMEKVYLNIGLSFLEEKNCEKATTSFQLALEIDPTYSAPYFNLGKCQSASGRLKDAQASFQRAVDFCPGCLDPQLELAAVSVRLGERKKALIQLDSILQARPSGAIELRALALRKQIAK